MPGVCITAALIVFACVVTPWAWFAVFAWLVLVIAAFDAHRRGRL